ncbi:V-type ATPase subunit, partial [Enterococcus faecium]|uniref:V-type ATPase subunit n=1 Tax=Enterococcus faecium TaxID=1352 RepID=UPI003CC68008
LSNETFERKIQTKSVVALSEILNSTIYSPYIYDGYEYDFEQYLLKEQSRLFRWFKESAREPEIVWIYTMRYTYHNLKV